MAHPWDPDHGLGRNELGARLARALASGAFQGTPKFPADVNPRWFAQGWDCDVFDAFDRGGVRWLCKLPKRDGVQAWLAKEAGLLEHFRRSGFELAPRLGLRGQQGRRGQKEELPYEWIGLSVAPGSPISSHLEQVDPSVVGASYGAALRAVHALVPEALGERPRGKSHLIDLVEMRRTLASVRRHTPEWVADRAEAWVARTAARDAEDVAVCFVHNDLFPEHVYVDPSSGRVSALIDWADACWDDPAIDFAPLAWLLGDAFLDSALGAYGGDADGLRERAVRLGTLCSLHDVDAAANGAPNVPLSARVEIVRMRAAEGWFERD